VGVGDGTAHLVERVAAGDEEGEQKDSQRRGFWQTLAVYSELQKERRLARRTSQRAEQGAKSHAAGLVKGWIACVGTGRKTALLELRGPGPRSRGGEMDTCAHCTACASG
jgi:hypothetical protein